METKRYYNNNRRNSFNRLKMSEEFKFGQFKGIEIGMIYLIKPDYIEWVLANTDKYLVDIEDAKTMKVIHDMNINSRVNLYGSGLNDEILGEKFYKRFSFKELMHSGFIDFKFSPSSLQYNDEKIALNGDNKQPVSFKYSDDSIMHFIIEINDLPNISFKAKCLDFCKTAEGQQYFVFSFDNSIPIVPVLRKTQDFRIASFFYPDWNISTAEFERKANADLVFNAQFKNGRFFIDS
ncbi:MAG: hypothetical protein PHW82_04775 [Bacteroidales bacterium]|nr:hypothetical protein [Bacteroidales bacterium]